eukprot:SAG31_NODE_273_length_18667_cov_3.603619_12_plen_104_part_00
MRTTACLVYIFVAVDGSANGARKSTQTATIAQQQLLEVLSTDVERLVGAASFGNLTLLRSLLAEPAVVTTIDDMPDEDAPTILKGHLPRATALGAAVRSTTDS